MAPELMMMNGSSMPKAPALANGVCETNSCVSAGQSRVVRTSVNSECSRGNCFGPTRTASA